MAGQERKQSVTSHDDSLVPLGVWSRLLATGGGTSPRGAQIVSDEVRLVIGRRVALSAASPTVRQSFVCAQRGS